MHIRKGWNVVPGKKGVAEYKTICQMSIKEGKKREIKSCKSLPEWVT
jgi:hypothetical protein